MPVLDRPALTALLGGDALDLEGCVFKRLGEGAGLVSYWLPAVYTLR